MPRPGKNFGWPVISHGVHYDGSKVGEGLSAKPGDAFAKKRGVCQDFAHLAIACFRSLGLAARYVSGYLETLPPPGKPKMVGADASHAWASL